MTAPTMAERLRGGDVWCHRCKAWYEVGDRMCVRTSSGLLCTCVACGADCYAADRVPEGDEVAAFGAAGEAAEGEA